jgi:hypothetical protein
MQSLFEKEILAARKPKAKPAESEARAQFRTTFKHALSGCLQKGFLLEECFGLIWEETLEEISLPEKEQRTLYEELLVWVKTRMKLE